MTNETMTTAASESVVSTRAQHTPGPWKYGHRGFDTLWVGPDYDQVPTAIVPWDCEDARASARENARLIAASPDMLATLRKHERVLSLRTTYGTRAKPTVAELNAMLEDFRAAIAKATQP